MSANYAFTLLAEIRGSNKTYMSFYLFVRKYIKGWNSINITIRNIDNFGMLLIGLYSTRVLSLNKPVV